MAATVAADGDGVQEDMGRIDHIQRTPLSVDGRPITLLSPVQRYPRIGTRANPISYAKLLARTDHLAAPVGYRLPHAGTPRAPTKAELERSWDAQDELLQVLYGFVLDPEWCLRFLPPSALRPIGQGPSGAQAVAAMDTDGAGTSREFTLPPMTENRSDKFSLAKVQQEVGNAEYGEGRRGKPCGHVFKHGEGVYHCGYVSYYACGLGLADSALRLAGTAASTTLVLSACAASTPLTTRVTT